MPLVPVEWWPTTGWVTGSIARLRGYKDAAVREARTTYCRTLARLLRRWYGRSPTVGWPAGWPVDLVVTVPSTQRPTGSSVDALVARVPALASRTAPC